MGDLSGFPGTEQLMSSGIGDLGPWEAVYSGG